MSAARFLCFKSLSTKSILQKMDPSLSLTCSWCKQRLEQETHRLCCCSTRQAAVEDIFLDVTLRSFLQDQSTCPELANTHLKEGIKPRGMSAGPSSLKVTSSKIIRDGSKKPFAASPHPANMHSSLAS
jgi:hypothetical protein